MKPDTIKGMIQHFQNVERKRIILTMPSMGEHSVRANNVRGKKGNFASGKVVIRSVWGFKTFCAQHFRNYCDPKV